MTLTKDCRIIASDVESEVESWSPAESQSESPARNRLHIPDQYTVNVVTLHSEGLLTHGHWAVAPCLLLLYFLQLKESIISVAKCTVQKP